MNNYHDSLYPKQFCPRCGYHLFEPGICPECGLIATKDELNCHYVTSILLYQWESKSIIGKFLTMPVFIPLFIYGILHFSVIPRLIPLHSRCIMSTLILIVIVGSICMISRLDELCFPHEIILRAAMLQPGLTWAPWMVLWVVITIAISLLLRTICIVAYVVLIRTLNYGLVILLVIQGLWVLWNSFGSMRNFNYFGVMDSQVMIGSSNIPNTTLEVLSVIIVGIPGIMIPLLITALPLLAGYSTLRTIRNGGKSGDTIPIS